MVATKGGLRRPGGAWVVDGDPDWLRLSCERSLQALQTDCISLYQLHAVDPRWISAARWKPWSSSRRKAGSAISACPTSAPRNWSRRSTLRDRVGAESLQSVRQAGFGNGLIDFCRARRITYIPYSPVGGHHGHVRLDQEPLLQQLAAKYQASPHRIALSWLLHKGRHILPIPAPVGSPASATACGRRI